MNSTHKSLRNLLDLGLSKSDSASPQTITRTLKFKIDTLTRPDLVPLLNRHFDVFEQFRRKVLDDLAGWWMKDPDSFQKMVKCSTKQKYEDKSSCYAWLYTHFLKGTELSPELSRDAANSMLDSLSGGLKSFLTRREHVTAEIARRYDDNLGEWQRELKQLASDLEAPLPAAPPELDFVRLTEAAIEGYNDWVGRTRAWCNLILIQQKKLARPEAFLPRYLKGYPGFPGSQRYTAKALLSDSLLGLERAARTQAGKIPARFADLSTPDWAAIQERFSPPIATDASEDFRPRTAQQTASRRLQALIRANSSWTASQFAEELLAGIFRATDKLKAHLLARGTADRRAVIKLANLYNLAAVFSLEPIRVTGDYVAYYAEDTLRRNTFANVRGGLHQPTDESVAIQITGFSISEEGTPNYNGLLACKSNGRHQDVWAFFYCHKEGQTFQLADESVKLRGKKLTEWLGFASRGGSRKKAEASAKQLVRGRVWVSECNAPTLLPLCMGYRQGREYLWNFDRDLRTKDGWVLGNGRLLRITPPDCPRLAEFYLTITLERQAPPLVAFTPEKLIGIDRGEAVPAAYAIIDRKGRLLESGRIAEGYREQQRKFNEAKRDLQRTKGGYTRWLRSKERNRARALGGEVTRALLDLCANHRAPLVLENLGSGPATRGGKGTIMSQMQYERVLTAIEQKLAETGLYALPSAAKFRKRDNGFIKLVGPAYTSSICSACGHLHDSEFYESVASTLVRANGAWHVALPTGKSRGLPEAYTYSVRGKGEQTKPTDERIAELLNGKPLAEASQTNRRTLVSLLKSRWLPFRPNQAEFQCVICGHKMNADEQAALNVARKFLFIAEQGTKSGEMSEGERRKMRTKWQAWYVNKLRTDWNSA